MKRIHMGSNRSIHSTILHEHVFQDGQNAVVNVLCYEDATEAAIAAKTLTQYATVVRGHNYPDDNDPAITSHGAIHARMNISISRVLFSMEDMSIMYHVKVIKRHAQNRFERMLLLLGRLLASIAFKQGMVSKGHVALL